MSAEVDHGSSDVPAGKEGRLGLSLLEHDGVVDLNKMPTRKERLGYSNVGNVSRYYESAPRWAKSVMCPVCGTNMKLLKGRKSQYGENLTFQCHAQVERGKYCLATMTLTVGNNYMMRPGDFESCDYNWEKIAEETLRIEDGDKVLQSSVSEHFEKPTMKPPNPWKREVQSRVIWEVFWDAVLENGSVTESALIEGVQTQRPSDRKGRGLFKLQREIENLPRWMTNRTGYAVKLIGQELVVVGKTSGNINRYPYSEEDYRKSHGMETI